jgi:hypothetical protein
MWKSYMPHVHKQAKNILGKHRKLAAVALPIAIGIKFSECSQAERRNLFWNAASPEASGAQSHGSKPMLGGVVCFNCI